MSTVCTPVLGEVAGKEAPANAVSAFCIAGFGDVMAVIMVDLV
jgi:hypothetical protein